MQQVGRNDPCPCGSGKKYKKCCMSVSKIKSLREKIFAKDKVVYLALILILIFSIFIRYYGFNQPHNLTFDEGLYAELLGEQLNKDLTNYSTQSQYHFHTAKGEHLPEYLNRPLFKHPPLYPYLIAFSYSLSGSSLLSAVNVSVLFGSLMIVAIFFLGKVLFDNRVGLLSAFFLCLDPIHWICSEKIWMETTMSFFILSAILLFVLGLKQKIYFLFSGISIGLAVLTKYPGILPLFIIISFVILFERQLLKTKYFWFLIILTFFTFSPWVFWNYKVYGNFHAAFISPHGIPAILKNPLFILSIFLFLGAMFYLIKYGRDHLAGFGQKVKIVPKSRTWLVFLGFCIILASLIISPSIRETIKGSLVWNHNLEVGWRNPFANDQWHFYLKRLLELSPLYLFAFISPFLLFLKNKGDGLLVWSSIWLLGFFIFWGNYQSRYILPAVPFLILLSARLQVWIYDRLTLKEAVIDGRPNAGKYQQSFSTIIVRTLFFAAVIYFILKTLRADMLLALTNDFGYF